MFDLSSLSLSLATVAGVTYLEHLANHGWGVSFAIALGSYMVGALIGYAVGKPR